MNIVLQIHSYAGAPKYAPADAVADLGRWSRCEMKVGQWRVTIDYQGLIGVGRDLTGCGRWERGLFIWSGRIRNRLQLTRRLGLPRSTTTKDLIRHGLNRWSERFYKFVKGQIVLALVDEVSRKIVWWRDRFGFVPTMYRRQRNKRMWIATCLCAELSCALRPKEHVDVTRLSRFISRRHDCSRHDFFESVYRVTPGQKLEVFLGRDLKTAYSKYRLEISSAEQDPEWLHFRRVRQKLQELLQNELLEATRPVLSLSSGLDSSLLLALWSDLRRSKRGVPPPRTATISLPRNGGENEAPVASQLAEEYGADHLEIAITDVLPMSRVDVFKDFWGYGPCFHAGELHETIFSQRVAHEYSKDSILSGVGGEELYPAFLSARIRFLLSRLLNGHDLSVLGPLSRLMSRHPALFLFLQRELRHLAREAVPPGVLKSVRRFLRTYRALSAEDQPWWTPRLFALVDSHIDNPTTLYDGLWDSWGWEYAVRMGWRLQMRSRLYRGHPFLSGVLHELASRVPSATVQQDDGAGVWRPTMRRLCAGQVPESIRVMPKRGHFTTAIWRGWYENSGAVRAILEFPHLAEEDLIHPDRVVKVWDEFVRETNGFESCEVNPPMGGMTFWAPMSAEIWLST